MDHFCPECSKAGVLSKLKLYQINLFEAVYLCDGKCNYPKGHSCIIVKRDLKRLQKENGSNKQMENTEIDDWLNEICSDNDRLTSVEDQSTYQQSISDITRELNINLNQLVTSSDNLDVEIADVETVPSRTTLRTYKRKNKPTNQNGKLEKFYSSLSTKTLIEDVLKSANAFSDSIDYVRPEYDDTSLHSEINMIENYSLKDIYRHVLKIASNIVRDCSIERSSENQKQVLRPELIDKMDDDKLRKIKTVYQNERLAMKVYNSIYELPRDYQEKIFANSIQEENFTFHIVPPNQLEKVLEDSIAKNYSKVKKIVASAKKTQSPAMNTRSRAKNRNVS